MWTARARLKRALAPISVLVVCLVAYSLRTYHLSTQSLWYDEAFSVEVTKRSWVEMIQFMASIVDNHPPLYYAVLHSFIVLGGTSEYVVRYPSVACGLLCVPLVRYLVLLATGSQGHVRCAAAWATTVLMTCSPVLIWYSQETRMYSQAAMFCLGGTICLCLLMTESPFPRRAGWLAVGAVLCDTAALYSHVFSGFVVAAQAVVVVGWITLRIARTVPKRATVVPWSRIAVLVGSFACVGIGFLPWAWLTVARLGVDDSYFQGTLPLRLLLHDTTMLLAGSDTPQPALSGVLALGGTAIVLGIIAAVGPAHGSSPARWCILIGALLPVILLFLLAWHRPKFSSRYLLASTPFWYALAGLGVGWLWSARHGVGYLARVGSVALVIGLLFGNVLDLRRVWDGQVARDDWRGVAAYIEAHGGRGDPVLLVSGHAYPAFLYYAPWAHWAGLPSDVTLSTAHTVSYGDASALNRLVGDARTLWIVRWQADVADPDHVVGSLVAQRGRQLLQGPDFHGVDVQEYELTPGAFSPSPERTHLAVMFGDDVRLVGMDQVPNQPIRIESGSSINLTLYWQAAKTLTVDYRVSVRVRDAAGHEWGAFDARPAGEFNPAMRWTTGETTSGVAQIPLRLGTPPGHYVVDASLYDPSSPQLAKLSATDPEHRSEGASVAIATLEVMPSSKALGPSDLTPAVAGHADSGLAEYEGLAEPLPAMVTPGQNVTLLTYWTALQNLPQPPTFRVRFAGQDGLTPPSVKRPSGDASATWAWREGEALLWQIDTTVPAATPPGPTNVEVALDSGGLVGHFVELGPVRAAARPAARAAAPPAHAVNATFRDGIHLDGFDLDPETAVVPGTTLRVTLHWRTAQVMANNWTVFVHLVGADRSILAQHDGPPSAGTAPTASWLPGETIADGHDLVIPASATAQDGVLEIGLYDPISGTRDGVAQGGDSVRLGRVAIGHI